MLILDHFYNQNCPQEQLQIHRYKSIPIQTKKQSYIPYKKHSTTLSTSDSKSIYSIYNGFYSQDTQPIELPLLKRPKRSLDQQR